MYFKLMTISQLIRPAHSFRLTPVVKVASFHIGRASAFRATKTIENGAEYIKGTVNEAVVLPPKDKVAGSYHWDFERFLSFLLIPLTVTSVVKMGHPITDLCLGVILPFHCHLGFDAMITDYYPSHRSPVLNKVLTWSLRGATLIALYGCYEFNTNDVGMTELVKK
ncbi:28088_t:CDS:2, partial [Racocetra persica]